jgi:hypothetical protein
MPGTPVVPSSGGLAMPPAGISEVVFPGRQDAYLFRSTDLEQLYRGQLARQLFTTAVDPEGSVVWVSEYLRYRVNDCSHQEASARILAQIQGVPSPPVCSPRQQPVPDRRDALNFRRELEQTYVTVLRRSPSPQTYVDDEGDVIWTMEYLRYRLSGCEHQESITKIVDQINSRGVPRDCARATETPRPVEPPPPPPTLRADFSVYSGGRTGQCQADRSSSGYLLSCTFDGSASTPRGEITAYEWDVISGAVRGSGMRVENVSMPCGSFGSTSASSFQRPVTLTVYRGSEKHSATKSVTFIVPNFC